MFHRCNKTNYWQPKYTLDARKDLRDAHLGAMGETCFTYKAKNLNPLDKNFHAIKVINKETGKVDGVIHAFTRNINGKKNNDTSRIWTKKQVSNQRKIHPNQIQQNNGRTKSIAKRNGYHSIHSTTRPSALSNRETIAKIIKKYPKINLKHKIYGQKQQHTHYITKIKRH